MLSDRPGPLYTVDTVVVALSVSLLYMYMYRLCMYMCTWYASYMGSATIYGVYYHTI